MVKIILCTYNGEKYIEEQLLSILNQQNIAEDSYSILVSDDGSYDHTVEIIKKIQRRYLGKIEFKNNIQKSGGAARHFLTVLRDLIIEKDQSDYYMFCDQDDIWEQDKIEMSVEVMQQMEQVYSRNIPLIAFCDAKVIDSEDQVIAESFTKYQKISTQCNTFNKLLLQNCVTGAAMIFNSELAKLVNTVPKYVFMHDMWMALLASDKGQIRYIDKPLYRYRQHESNVLGASKGSMWRESIKRIQTYFNSSNNNINPYQVLYSQAEEFAVIYNDILSEKNKNLISKFIALNSKNRIEKIYIIIKYGFTYNKLYRTIGECIFL